MAGEFREGGKAVGLAGPRFAVDGSGFSPYIDDGGFSPCRVPDFLVNPLGESFVQRRGLERSSRCA